MAPEKRKRGEDESAARPEKKQKPSTASRLVVPKEEPAFQRGGASILTPLEQKQIQIQATRDALFEERTGQKATNTEFGEDENQEDTSAGAATLAAKTPKKTQTGRGSKARIEPSQEEGIRIEGLSYKVDPCCSVVQHKKLTFVSG